MQMAISGNFYDDNASILRCLIYAGFDDLSENDEFRDRKTMFRRLRLAVCDRTCLNVSKFHWGVQK